MYTKKKDSLHLPAEVLADAKFTLEDPLAILSGPSMLLVLKRKLTAIDLVNICSQLHQLTGRYTDILCTACGECDDCGGDGCPFDPNCENITLPTSLRGEAGIPENAKLCAEVDEESGAVTIRAADYEYDLSDVPKDLLDRLVCFGACLGGLEKKLISGQIVHTHEKEGGSHDA